MDEQMNILWTKMKEEMERQNQKQTQIITENLDKKLEEHLAPIRMENEALKTEIETLRSKVKYLDLESRKNNVILHGVEENEVNSTDLMNKVLDILNKTNDTQNGREEWDKWEVNKLHRIGKKLGNKLRPIKISFTLTWRRNDILKKWKKLGEGIYVTEDLPKEEVEARKALYPKLKEARASGKYAIIKNGKLIIREKLEAEKRKRVPSSPPTTPPGNFSKAQGKGRATQPIKVTKTNPFEAMRNRVNSQTEELLKN